MVFIMMISPSPLINHCSKVVRPRLGAGALDQMLMLNSSLIIYGQITQMMTKKLGKKEKRKSFFFSDFLGFSLTLKHARWKFLIVVFFWILQLEKTDFLWISKIRISALKVLPILFCFSWSFISTPKIHVICNETSGLLMDFYGSSTTFLPLLPSCLPEQLETRIDFNF